MNDVSAVLPLYEATCAALELDADIFLPAKARTPGFKFRLYSE